MRIVFKKATKAILAAGELASGDVIVNPAAVDVYPAYDSAVDGTFTKDSGNPTDLDRNPDAYEVDSVTDPTDTPFKRHLELVLGSATMSADGQESQVVTVNLKDQADSIISTSMTVDLATTAGFLPLSQITLSAGTGTFVLVSANSTVVGGLTASDAAYTTVAGRKIYGAVPAITTVSMVATPTVQKPSAGLVSNPMVRRSIHVNFSCASAIGVGTAVTTQGSMSMENSTKAIGTLFTSGGGDPDYAGVVATTLEEVMLQNRPTMGLLFGPPPVSGARFFGGLTTSNIAISDAGQFIGVRYDPGAGDTKMMLVAHNGSDLSFTNSNLAPGDAEFWRLDIYPDPASAGAFVVRLSGIVGGEVTMTAARSFASAAAPSNTQELGYQAMLGTHSSTQVIKLIALAVEADTITP